jgi:hypothetical protein
MIAKTERGDGKGEGERKKIVKKKEAGKSMVHYARLFI